MRSQKTIGELWSVAQYGSYNAWFYNGNNGKLNNNNKYNSNSARSLDYNIWNFANRQDFRELLLEFYEAWRVCRSKKRNKSTSLEFEFTFSRSFIPLVIEVYTKQYTAKPSIAFIIEQPRIREVIAAHFSDRVVQTWYALKLKPLFESEWYDDDSYSCREGRGGLCAVQKLHQYIREETNNYTTDAWVVKKDIQAFFMSIDPVLLESWLIDFIWQHFGEDPQLRSRLCWLTTVIYRALPQDNCILRSSDYMWSKLNPRKSMFGKTIGLPIGNRTSQDAANFVTTFYLSKLREKGYKFAHYTDDTAIVVKDLKQWRKDELEIEKYIKDELHLTWHPTKKYIQYYTNGVEFLGYRMCFDRTLPSKRISHNFKWSCECIQQKVSEWPTYMYYCRDSFMQTFNSYVGLLKWCNSYRFRKSVIDKLKKSRISYIYNFHGCDKITIRPQYTRKQYFVWKNQQIKNSLKTYNND